MMIAFRQKGPRTTVFSRSFFYASWLSYPGRGEPRGVSPRSGRETIMRYAICNETFEGWEHARVCATIAELGYQGLEIAPFTLAPRITDVSAHDRTRLRTEAERNGLQILGLHWLLAKTEGMQLTSPDEKVRQTTADYLVDLARACRDLGGDILVFGSPAQRRIPQGSTRQDAEDWAVDTFGRALPGLESTGVKV